MEIQPTKIEITSGIIWRTVLIVLFVVFLFFIRDVLLLLFLSIVIVSAALPVVNKMEDKKIPRALGTLFLFLGLISILAILFYLMSPILAEELKQLSQLVPSYAENINKVLQNISELAVSYQLNGLQEFINSSSEKLSDSFSNVFSNALTVFSGFLKIIVVFSLSFYMLVKKNGTELFIGFVTPKKHQKYVVDLTYRIQAKMGRWLIGQVVLIFIVFGLYYLVLTLLGVPFPLLIALIGGLLEIVPYIGPILASVPAGLAALTISPWAMIVVFLSYFVIQQIEAYVLTPLIMKKAVGLNPVIIILALLIGAKLAGLPGVILAIPTTTAIAVILNDLRKSRDKTQEADA